jgi:hypothetical protein
MTARAGCRIPGRPFPDGSKRIRPLESRPPTPVRYPLVWKRSVVGQTFEPGASVASVARDNSINANQVRAWRKLYAQGLLIEGKGGIVTVSFTDCDAAALTHRAQGSGALARPSLPKNTPHPSGSRAC